jgi:hypothetical protein
MIDETFEEYAKRRLKELNKRSSRYTVRDMFEQLRGSEYSVEEHRCDTCGAVGISVQIKTVFDSWQLCDECHKVLDALEYDDKN